MPRPSSGSPRRRPRPRPTRRKMPALLGCGGALLFLIAGVVVLCMTLALALAPLIGPLAGGLIAVADRPSASPACLVCSARQELEKLK